MKGWTWLSGRSEKLIGEHPDAYKGIHEIVRLSADLVKVKHRLDTVLNYKGT